MKPNLFDYATKELSQDAFLAWYFAWADESMTEDSNLQKNAREFLYKYISRKYKNYNKPITHVEIDRQHQFIDILVTVNNDIKIIIEDKVFTNIHSKQLERYWNKIDGKKIGLYIKTGDESADRAPKIESINYFPIYRNELLEHFNSCCSRNVIFLSFIEHWNTIERNSKSYIIQTKWKNIHVIGFYQDLQKIIKKSNWHYASNPRGGDFVFNWNWIELDTLLPTHGNIKTQMYLEFSFPCSIAGKADFIEEFKLKVKIHLSCENDNKCLISKDNLNILRHDVKAIHLNKFNELSKGLAKRPSRSRRGAYMTISEISFSELINHDISQLNLMRLAEKLSIYENLLTTYKIQCDL